MKPRFAAIAQHFQGAREVYDLACDHGLIGLEIKKQNPEARIHFVDHNQNLINKLKSTNSRSSDQFLCKDVLEYSNYVNNSHACLAGVGGRLCAMWIEYLFKKKLLDNFKKLIIVPHQHVWHLRRCLQKYPLELLAEELVLDNNQIYQVLVLRSGKGERISMWGESLWDHKVLAVREAVFNEILEKKGYASRFNSAIKSVRVPHQKTLALIRNRIKAYERRR